jgi:hypothetical protein
MIVGSEQANFPIPLERCGVLNGYALTGKRTVGKAVRALQAIGDGDAIDGAAWRGTRGFEVQVIAPADAQQRRVDDLPSVGEVGRIWGCAENQSISANLLPWSLRGIRDGHPNGLIQGMWRLAIVRIRYIEQDVLALEVANLWIVRSIFVPGFSARSLQGDIGEAEGALGARGYIMGDFA